MSSQHEDYSSAQEYAQALIDDIFTLEKSLPDNERITPDLLRYWCKEIRLLAEQCWNEYLAGKRDDHKFSEEEFVSTYDKAGLRYTGDLIEGLVEDGYVQMGVREDGEIVYSATNKGKKYLDRGNRNED